MSIVTESQIAEAIRECAPTRVAVAYLGADWKTFLPSVLELEFVIISPTLGTNPQAVGELARAIGWERVFLLDQLHAKVYFGKNGAIIGSANLSRNGLSGKALRELCVVIRDTVVLGALPPIMDAWRDRAAERYPDEQAKKKKLAALVDITNAAYARRLIKRKEKRVRSFDEFTLFGNSHFYVSWYENTDQPVIDPKVKEAEEQIAATFLFREKDQVKSEKWLLAWKITKDRKPNRATTPYWFYIDSVFKKGVCGEKDYTTCGIQRSEENLPPLPFNLTDDVVSAFRRAIVHPDLEQFFIQSKKPVYNLNESVKGLPLLIDRMRLELKARIRDDSEAV